MTSTAPRVLILAGDSDGNLGDLAIVSATCDYLRRLHPGTEVSLVTNQPRRDRERLGIRPIARGWRGLPALVAAARRADFVICGGGGLFQDDDSLLKMPYWAIRLAFVRLFSRRICGLSIGAGPLDHPVSRAFARLALRTLDPVTARDAYARDVLSQLTTRPVEVVPDPAFLLVSGGREDARRCLRDGGVPLDGRPLIGVAVRRWFHTDSNLVPHKYLHRIGLSRRRGGASMAVFVERTAAALDRVVAETGGHVVFLPTYNVGHEDDAAVCERVAGAMQEPSHSLFRLDDPKRYKAICGELAVMLCGRMHPAILAAAAGTPVVGLSYNPKFPGMFSLLGREDLCVPIRDFVRAGEAESQVDGIVRRLQSAIRDSGGARPRTDALQLATRRTIEAFIDPKRTGVASAVANEPAGR